MVPPNQEEISVGQSILLSATYVDPNDADTHNYEWTVTDESANGQLVAEGTDPTFTFTPEAAGDYTITYVVSDLNGGTGTTTVQIEANAGPLYVTPPASTQQSAAEGESTSFDLGGLNVSEAGPFDVTVQWGDLQTSSFTVDAGGELTYSHTYDYEGAYTISETITDSSGASTNFTFAENSITVIDQPVFVTPVPVSAVVGAPTGTVLVATFTDPEGADPVGDYTASVSSADPNFTTGNITYEDGVFSVYADLTFDQAGSDSITVTISHLNSEPTTIVTSAAVAQAVSTTTLATPSSIVYGRSTTWTATVTGYETLGETVSFYFGAVNPADQIGTAAIFSVGNINEAVLNVSGLPTNSGYSLTAVYGGDTNNEEATSNTVTQVVTPAP